MGLSANEELQVLSKNDRQHGSILTGEGGALRMCQNGGIQDWRIPVETKTVKVFALSDVHADFRPNLEWLRDIQPPDQLQDGHNILLLAGDLATGRRPLPLSDIWSSSMSGQRICRSKHWIVLTLLFVWHGADLGTLREGLQVVKEKFDEVVFVPGNHELWTQMGDGKQNAKDSMQKMEEVIMLVMRAGEELNVGCGAT
jgi:predicted MPP superfamily phosphohydrolase